MLSRTTLVAAGILMASFGTLARAESPEPEFPLRIDGDLGLGGYYTRSIIRGKTENATLLPYAYFDYGRLFARIDTFGIKTAKLGYGYLELAARVSLDGFKADTASLRGLGDRKNPLPVGIGTFQETPVGAFFVNAFVDANKSKGSLLDAVYVAKFGTGRVTVYPQAGAEYLSKQYVGYYYGISGPESAASGYAAYQPGGAFNPYVGAMVDTSISQDWHLNLYLRHKWLDSAVRNSPIVNSKGMDTAFVALAYRFK